MLSNVQALRALAAIAVVVFHFGLLPGTALPFRYGAAGVDLFFVLSGFIIAYASRRDRRHFLVRRLIRILPPFWIATIIASLFTLEVLSLREAWGWLLQSLFYLPGPGGRPALIFVAWTLVYELAFYLLYWLALQASARNAPLLAILLLLALAILGVPGLIGAHPLLLEFALGIFVFLLSERIKARAGSSLGLVLIAAGMLALPLSSHLTAYDPNDYRSLQRVLNWGLPAAAIVLGAVLAERGGLIVRNRSLLALGASSYAIYLLHPVAVGQLLKLPPAAPPLSWATCLAATAATTAIAVIFYRMVEEPLLRALRKKIEGAGAFARRPHVTRSRDGDHL